MHRSLSAVAVGRASRHPRACPGTGEAQPGTASPFPDFSIGPSERSGSLLI